MLTATQADLVVRGVVFDGNGVRFDAAMTVVFRQDGVYEIAVQRTMRSPLRRDSSRVRSSAATAGVLAASRR